MDSVVCPVHGDQRLTDIAQRWVAGGSYVLFGQHHPHPPPLFELADRMDTDGVAAEAPCRLLGHLGLGDKPAGRRIPPGELDAGRFADVTASSIAADEVLGPHGLTVGQLDVDASVVLCEACHLTSAIDRHPQLANPVRQDTLDVGLPECEKVAVASREVTDVDGNTCERCATKHLPL